MASPVIQLKRGLLANLPGLQAGEPGFTTDKYDLYVGIDSTTSNNQFVGSGRYWQVNTTTVGSGVKLVEGSNNGSNAVILKAPNSIASDVTFTMPGSDGSDGHVLVTDGSGALSFSAPSASSFTLAADSGSSDTFNTGETLTFTGGEAVDTTVSNNAITIACEDATETNKGVATFDGSDFTVTSGDVTVNAERIQDIAGAMFSSNTETRITATYQDADGTIDLVVDNDLSNYDNTSSAFITASSSSTLTNKTFDVEGSGNSISNIDVADFKAAAIVIESEGIGSNDNDSTLPTSAAVKNYVDSASTSGNAATATALATARNIGGVSFDGTANINLPGVNTAGNQDTTGTATNASHVLVTDNESTNEENLITFVENATSSTGNVGLEMDGNLTYNPSSGTLTSTAFAGALTGNVTGNASGSSGSCTGNAATATVATSITLADESSDTSCNVVFTTAATGNLEPKTGTNLTFNSSSGALTATTFVGALTGNVTGNTSGSSGSCSGNAAGLTGTPSITVDEDVAASLDISGNVDIDGT